MAHIQRMIRLALYGLIGFIIGGYSVIANADEYDPGWHYYVGTATDVPKTPTEVWQAWKTSTGDTISQGFTLGTDTIDKTILVLAPMPWYVTGGIDAPKAAKPCNAGDTVKSPANAGTLRTCVTPACVQPLVRDPLTHLCAPPPTLCKAEELPMGNAKAGQAGIYCDGKCKIQWSFVIGINAGGSTECWDYGPGTQAYCSYGRERLAESCSGVTNPDNSKPPDLPDDCAAKKMCSGTVNGAVLCVACDQQTTSENKKSSTTNNPPPGSPTPPKTTDTSTDTTCVGEKCTTTETTTTTSGGSGPGGTGPGSTTETDVKGKTVPKNDYCAENPQSKICKKSDPFCTENPDSPMCKKGTFTGDCATNTPPVCDGDAVQCAQAKEAFKIHCAITKEPDSAAYNLGKLITGGDADPMATSNPLLAENQTTFNIGEMIDTEASKRTLSGACPTSISVLSATMDLTLFCRFAEMVGYMMVAASSVIAVRMVASGNI